MTRLVISLIVRGETPYILPTSLLSLIPQAYRDRIVKTSHVIRGGAGYISSYPIAFCEYVW